jgi:cytochrome P450
VEIGTSLNSIDHSLTDPVWFSTNDPHAIWRRLRAEDPVHWTEGKLPFGFWSLTKHEDIRRVLRDPHTFSSERGEGSNLPTSSEIVTIDRETAGFGVMMVSTDPPRHAPVRRAFARTFLRNAIQRFESQGRLLAREILDEVEPLGACDFVDDIAVKMPMRFICALMGIPREDWGRMLALGNMSANPEEPEYRRGRSAQETRASAFE